MRIGVLSPVSHGTGASCISLLLALRLGQGTDRVCLTHTHHTDTSLRDAAGVAGMIDKTTTPSMMIRTFQSVSTMSEQEYAQYCASVTRDVDLFTCTRAGDAVCIPEDARYLAKYAAEKFPHKHVVIDVDDHTAAVEEEVISYSDVVVFVVRVDGGEIAMFRNKLLKYKKSGVLSGKRIAVIFNRYHSAIVKQKDLARDLGTLPKYVYYMPFNEFVAWAAYNHKFPQFWQFVANGDSRVSVVRAELDRLILGVRKQKVESTEKSVGVKLLGVKMPHLKDAQKQKKEYVKLTGVQEAAQRYAEDKHEAAKQLTQEALNKQANLNLFIAQESSTVADVVPQPGFVPQQGVNIPLMQLNNFGGQPQVAWGSFQAYEAGVPPIQQNSFGEQIQEGWGNLQAPGINSSQHLMPQGFVTVQPERNTSINADAHKGALFPVKKVEVKLQEASTVESVEIQGQVLSAEGIQVGVTSVESNNISVGRKDEIGIPAVITPQDKLQMLKETSLPVTMAVKTEASDMVKATASLSAAVPKKDFTQSKSIVPLTGKTLGSGFNRHGGDK